MRIVMTALRRPELLRAHMADRHLSVRGLAACVTRQGNCRCSASSIGALTSGRSRLCRYERARAIERALGLEPGELFTIENTPDGWFLDHTSPTERNSR